MMTGAVLRRANELADEGTAFVTATVVRAQHPTSVEAGNVALVLGDGTIDGFVGGVCAEHSVRAYSLKAIETGEAVLLRILPDGPDAGDDAIVSSEDGTVTVGNTCLSGGAIEVFLEPVLPPPRVLVIGETPIAEAVRSLGTTLGLDVVAGGSAGLEPGSGDLAVVIAAHGRDELHTLRRALEAAVPYVGLVASSKRGAGVLAELRADGVPDEQLELIDVPAGIAIGARTPAEIALSILAKIVAVRRGQSVDALGHARVPVAAPSPSSTVPVIAVDPICGMTVAAVAGTPSVEHDGETIYFCCDGCKAKFMAQPEHVGGSAQTLT
jgi:xanthine dehydrogenase accessory factor